MSCVTTAAPGMGFIQQDVVQYGIVSAMCVAKRNPLPKHEIMRT